MTQLRLILALGALAACIGAFFYGVGVGEDRQAARYARAQAALEKAVEANISAAQAADYAAAAAQAARATIYREIRSEIPTIVDRPVYRNVCLDADGVRALDRAISAANGGGAPAGGADAAAGEDRADPGPD